MEAPQINLKNDAYYVKEYTSLYLGVDDSLFEFEYNEGEKKILFRSIKRRISCVSGIMLDEELYDLLGHYGYGGPLTNDYSEEFLLRAFESYKLQCMKEKIVCEFFRFHPFNPLSSTNMLFNFHVLEREVVVVDLTLNSEDRWKLYSKTTRNILRKTRENLVRRSNFITVEQFKNLYQKTMDKNQANNFYYFDELYFKRLTCISGVDLLSIHLNESIISCGYFMHSGDLAHYHLSANNSDFLKENGNYELLEFAFEHAKTKGCHYMMLGGGRTSAADDPLFRFKSKFSPVTLPFYISGLDFLPQKKAELNKLWDDQNSGNNVRLFQKYRA